MFGKKTLLKKRPASDVAFQMAGVINAVDNLIEKKALKIELGTILIYPELLRAAHNKEAYVKNLFMYCRLKEILKADQVLYIKDMETGAIIAQYINEKSLVFI